MTEALITIDRQSQSIAISGELEAKKESVLTESALVCRVIDAETNKTAAIAQQNLSELRRLVEKAEEEAKKPLNKLRNSIIETCREFLAEVRGEEMRLAKLAGDFQALENAKRRAAENAEAERLSQLERDRQKALAEAKTHEELDKVQERFHEKTQETIAAPVPIRAEGQKVIEDWEIEVTDIWLLARAHPACVEIRPRLSEIKGLLKAGATVKGIRAEKITLARTSGRRAIEV